MNARSHLFDFTVEGSQIADVVLSLFHTVLFHRASGKIRFKRQGPHEVGTVGYEDVECDRLLFTYVRCTCPALDSNIRSSVDKFADGLQKSSDPKPEGKISLEFYERKRNHWPFGEAATPWEVWTAKVTVVQPRNERERRLVRERAESDLADMVLSVVRAVNRLDYVPHVPAEKDLQNVFDTSHREVDPYLHRISVQLGDDPSQSGVAGTLRKMIREIAY
eukprot:m.310420 g.310420  ORF g.310420 m.310420 type:complete len:220 (+) comp51586_c0_seq1:76-735(+)